MQGGKSLKKKMNRATMSCGATSGGLIHGLLKYQNRREKKYVLKWFNIFIFDKNWIL